MSLVDLNILNKITQKSEPKVVAPDERKIIILWPTIRPKNCCNMIRKWLANRTTKNPIEIYIGVNTFEQEAEIVSENIPEITNIEVCGDERPGVTRPLYMLSSKLDEDYDGHVVISASDDFYAGPGWDDFVLSSIFKDCCLLVDDGIQNRGGVITIPIMSYGVLRKLNHIIYHPAYFHLYADNELWINCVEMGLIKDVREHGVIFQHQHYVNNKRTQDSVDKKINGKSKTDQETWNKRRKSPLEYRLDPKSV